MMSSQIEFIRPKLLNNEHISSWFTLRNQESVHPERAIAGLNVGLNTDEKESVIFGNRELLLNHVQLDAHQIAYAIQVHGTIVKKAEKGGTFPNTDGFVTSEKNLALAIQVADCAAVLLGDAKNHVIGAAHAGWRGAAGGILPKTIEVMKKSGANPTNIKAFVSPCISRKNFEVGGEVASRFPDEFVDRTNYPKPHVDLKSFLEYQLMNAGIPAAHIEINAHCTIADENYYSYRRQKEKSGRMMGIIKLN